MQQPFNQMSVRGYGATGLQLPWYFCSNRKRKKEEEEKLKSDIHEALLSAGRHFCGPRVTTGSLHPALLAPESCCRALILGCRHYSLLFLLLLFLLGIIQSITDEQAFMGEVGQLSLSLQEWRDLRSLLAGWFWTGVLQETGFLVWVQNL